MHLSRRNFIKLSIPAILLPLICRSSIVNAKPAETHPSFSPKSGSKAIYYDALKCEGCHYCETACWTVHDSSFTEVRIKENNNNDTNELLFWKFQCMHCSDATCVNVCPVGALSHNELGFVDYDKDKCIGCGYCAEFCPFQVPHMNGSKITGIQQMEKCGFCADLIADGQQPACAAACTKDALVFGDRDQLVIAGKKRVEELKETYPNINLYGESELNGLHLICLLPEPPGFYGLPEDPQVPLAANVWQDVLKPVGYALGGLTILVLAVNYFIARVNTRVERER
ncbi:4Fe-4S dicluster domain-containing protein [Chloroflexota bacterium]